jgi:hypothetical protein
MDKVADILNAAQKLSPDERRRLIIELDTLASQDSATALQSGGPYAALRALAGTIHSDFQDLSTDKYAHVGTAAGAER